MWQVLHEVIFSGSKMGPVVAGSLQQRRYKPGAATCMEPSRSPMYLSADLVDNPAHANSRGRINTLLSAFSPRSRQARRIYSCFLPRRVPERRVERSGPTRVNHQPVTDHPVAIPPRSPLQTPMTLYLWRSDSSNADLPRFHIT